MDGNSAGGWVWTMDESGRRQDGQPLAAKAPPGSARSDRLRQVPATCCTDKNAGAWTSITIQSANATNHDLRHQVVGAAGEARPGRRVSNQFETLRPGVVFWHRAVARVQNKAAFGDIDLGLGIGGQGEL